MSGPAAATLFDSNVWVALTFSAHPLHAPAQEAWLAASAEAPVLMCRATQLSTSRLLSTDAVVRPFAVPTPTNRQALMILDAWMASPNVRFAEEPANLLPRWRSLADLPTASPKRWMDAYLAAFAIESGVALVSADRVFASIPELTATVLVEPPTSPSSTP